MTPAQIDAIAARAAAATPDLDEARLATWALEREALADLAHSLGEDGSPYEQEQATLMANVLSQVAALLAALREAQGQHLALITANAEVAALNMDYLERLMKAEAERDAALAHVAELEADVEAVGRDLDNAERWRAQFMAERDTALSSLADAQTRAAAQQETIDGLRAAGEEARRKAIEECIATTLAVESEYDKGGCHNSAAGMAVAAKRIRALLAKETT